MFWQHNFGLFTNKLVAPNGLCWQSSVDFSGLRMKSEASDAEGGNGKAHHQVQGTAASDLVLVGLVLLSILTLSEVQPPQARV